MSTYGKQSTIDNFIAEYNRTHAPISSTSEGIVLLQSNADKWGIEKRVYLQSKSGIPDELRKRAKKNDTYKAEYPFRISDNALVGNLLNEGFNVGKN